MHDGIAGAIDGEGIVDNAALADELSRDGGRVHGVAEAPGSALEGGGEGPDDYVGVGLDGDFGDVWKGADLSAVDGKGPGGRGSWVRWGR